MKQLRPFLIFVIVLNSCTSEFKPATFETISIEESFEADITAMYNKASGNSDLGNTINSTIEKAIINTLSTPENNEVIKEALNDFNSDYIKFKKDFPEESEPVWELHIETEKTFQSEEVITIAISTYEFKGGAHGNDKIIFLNLDAKSGRVLNQKDIIENEADFKKLAQSHFINALEAEVKNLKIEDFFFGKPFQLPENIGFTDDGLVLLYNVYEVASFEQGYTEFVIPFEEIESYLKVN
ncbi:DUF3298 and DUF4163 domain-containing protein [uncultured Winogradskyella sp.]|uniref:DUF3298 and DUF4163 domain-containing protein n=1 Tax=uncultured Winogradskyella sp. TaxID=395353 RepID=UPI00261027E5|nr:DUF3298 and DUF4163 domain-containing protein [uncultured Winogradskyella sp.]